MSESSGPLKNYYGSWRIRRNREINNLIHGTDTVRFIKGSWIAWLGHTVRMEQHRIPRNIVEWRLIGRRSRVGPRKRWIEYVEEDLRTMGMRRCDERAEWSKIVEEAKTHAGL